MKKEFWIIKHQKFWQVKKNKDSYEEKIDLRGVGCIMAELYTNIIPFFAIVKINKTKWICQLNGIFKKLGKPKF